jgi:hypothetical protein
MDGVRLINCFQFGLLRLPLWPLLDLPGLGVEPFLQNLAAVPADDDYHFLEALLV